MNLEMGAHSAGSRIIRQENSVDILTHGGLDAFFLPAPRSGVPSAWYGHVPFAYWIMTALRPRLFVELGTQHGVSYAAFCDAASRAALDTRCFAIDTWQGDEHAGLYEEDVYENLRAFHDVRFGAFSELIRTTFDHALTYFEDGSIDLLHIDGCHSYEAVRHDFESWRPKLSPRAVVLFHDTNVRERDFGVWRFWAELRSRPKFEFLHGHGLGVLALGHEVPEAVLQLCNLSEASETARVRNRFAFSGRCCTVESDVIQLRGMAEAEGRARIEAEQLSSQLNEALERVRGEADTLSAQLREAQVGAAAEEALKAAKRESVAAQTALAAARADLSKSRMDLLTAQANLESSQDELIACRDELAYAKHTLTQQGAHIAALLNSTSWKLTRPVRATVISIKLQMARLDLVRRALMLRGTEQRKVLMQSLARRFGRRRQIEDESIGLPDDRYQDWISRFDTLRPADVHDIRHDVVAGSLPNILVLVCVTSESKLEVLNTIASLRSQLRDNWHALVCFGPAGNVARRGEFEAILSHDPRFAIAYQTASQTAWHIPTDLPVWKSIVVVAAGITIREHTLYTFAAHALDCPDAKLLYSDEDRVELSGVRHTPFFKPDFSPDLLSSMPYIGRCYLLQDVTLDLQDLLEQLFTPAGIVDHVTRLAQGLARSAVHHIPSILFHDNAAAGVPHQTARPPLLDVSKLPRVSIIIPTRNGLEVLAPCLASIRRLTAYPASKFEIVVVDNNSDDPGVIKFLDDEATAGAIKLISYSRPFNYSAINNFAVSRSAGELLVFLNNDTEVIRADWLQYLSLYAMREDVGAVGTKLLYPDYSVQHGGVVLGIQGVAGHAHIRLDQDSGGYQGLAKLTHEVAAVTGACLAIRRRVFQQIGGFDENLSVSFNDVLLCLRAISAGYRNVYVGDPLLIHHESKTRGHDNTPRKRQLFRKEAEYTREQHSRLFKLDPYYNAQLSLERPYGLAYPPRTVKPWRSAARRDGMPLRVLMLSITHQIGHGVAVVLRLQAEYLASKGIAVFIGGPTGTNEFSYDGCTRVVLNDPQGAACFAFENNIDCVVAHTPPFFSTFRWLGDRPRSIAYDYGEPMPDLFPDVLQRREQLAEKRFCIAMADRAFAISRSVQAESGYSRMGVIHLGNSHLAVWNDGLAGRRPGIRAALGLESCVIILNVCRFHSAERHYKGVNVYAEVAALFKFEHPELAESVVFLLAGKADNHDVVSMEAQGLRVFANLPDSELIDLYTAADVYMNFSLWEGYNLGIGQALALGLPVIASDIPAHREFPIPTAGTPEDAVRLLAELIARTATDEPTKPRQAVINDWSTPLEQFLAAVEDVSNVADR
jgi:GT2 family glycosyltransferase